MLAFCFMPDQTEGMPLVGHIAVKKSLKSQLFVILESIRGSTEEGKFNA